MPVWQLVTALAISLGSGFTAYKVLTSQGKPAKSKIIPPRKEKPKPAKTETVTVKCGDAEEEEDSDSDSDSEIEVDSDEEYEAPEGVVQYGLMDAPYKMVLCVNMSLKMDKGKIAAQCGHATLGAFKASMKFAPSNVQWWERTGQAKIAVKATEEQMFAASKAADELGLISYIVMDAGKTQIAAGSRTVCAIGPAPVHVLNEITSGFKLL
jgi:PTH2 family peptidyl-tRNA hydrolase